MPLTNPWLSEPAPDRVLPRRRLDERILNLLSSQNMCVLATAGPSGPLATPVACQTPAPARVGSPRPGGGFVSPAAPRSPKMRNIAADPRVSVGVFAPLVGLASSRGAQLFGEARVLPPGDPGREHYWEAFRWENEHVERGRSVTEPPGDTLVVIEPRRIVYTEHWLRREGFAARQTWTRADGGVLLKRDKGLQ